MGRLVGGALPRAGRAGPRLGDVQPEALIGLASHAVAHRQRAPAHVDSDARPPSHVPPAHPSCSSRACWPPRSAPRWRRGTRGARRSAHDHPRRGRTEEREALRALSLASLGPLPADPSTAWPTIRARPRSRGTALLRHAIEAATAAWRAPPATCPRPSPRRRAAGRGCGHHGAPHDALAGTAHGACSSGTGAPTHGRRRSPARGAVEHWRHAHPVPHEVAAHHRAEYEAVFGALRRCATCRVRPPGRGQPRARRVAPDPPSRQDEISRVYANVGKASPPTSGRPASRPRASTRYVETELCGPCAQPPRRRLTDDDRAGLRLFCRSRVAASTATRPRLTDDHFHNTGVGLAAHGAARRQRARGRRARRARREFNCLSRHSDALSGDCDELRFVTTEGEELVRAYKTPSLRGVAERARNMHAGSSRRSTRWSRTTTWRQRAGRRSELRPFGSRRASCAQLAAFLRTLSRRWRPRRLRPSAQAAAGRAQVR